MTEPLSPDELASAYLDGEVSADERAVVEADPSLGRRVEELRRARDAVRHPVPPPPAAQRDSAIHIAMAGPMTGARPRRSRWALALGGAAAALIVALVAVAALRSSGGGGGGLSSAELSTAAVPAAAPAADKTALPDLGAVDDAPALRTALRSLATREPATSGVTPTTTAPPAAAAGGGRGAGDGGTAGSVCTTDGTPIAVATWRGQPALVTSRPDGTVVVVRRADCTPLTTIAP